MPKYLYDPFILSFSAVNTSCHIWTTTVASPWVLVLLLSIQHTIVGVTFQNIANEAFPQIPYHNRVKSFSDSPLCSGSWPNSQPWPHGLTVPAYLSYCIGVLFHPHSHFSSLCWGHTDPLPGICNALPTPSLPPRNFICIICLPGMLPIHYLTPTFHWSFNSSICFMFLLKSHCLQKAFSNTLNLAKFTCYIFTVSPHNPAILHNHWTCNYLFHVYERVELLG